MIFSVRQFKGVAPRCEPRLLQDNQAQMAVNCKLWHGSLRPLATNLAVPNALSKPGTIQTIYRFGHDVESDSQYWFHWAADVDVCRGAIFGDAAERTYYTDGALPKVTAASIALTGGTGYPTNSYTLGLPAPTPCTATATGTGSGVAETRIYTYTYVSAWGEESAPAGASTPVDVLPGQYVSVTGLASAPTGNYNVTTKRIYRTATVGADTVFLFVAEIPVANSSYDDVVATKNLGEKLPSTAYAMPPASLRGLVSLPNGMMAGFTGKDIYLCEPYKPHAWPVSYVLTADYEVVALGVADTTLVVLTTGFPYLVQGSSPQSMTMVKAEVPQACVAKRSLAFLSGCVVYASPDGLFAIGSSGPPINLTELVFTNKEWRTFFKPSSIHGYVYDDKYIGFYDTGTAQGGFIVDPKRGDFTMFDWYATAGYYDPQRDALFLVVAGELVKFDEGGGVMTAAWRSKVFYSPRPINLGAIRLEAASYPVSIQVFADGTSIGTFEVAGPYAQRLPAGFVAKTWEFAVLSSIEVFSVSMAETMGEMANG